MVNNLVFKWPKPLFFMVRGAHGRYTWPPGNLFSVSSQVIDVPWPHASPMLIVTTQVSKRPVWKNGPDCWTNYSDLTRPHPKYSPNGGLVREFPLFQGNLGW